MKVRVECLSGYKANERPLRFQLNQTRYEVHELLDQWYGEDYAYFKVRADDNHIYILKYNEREDVWELTFYSEKKK